MECVICCNNVSLEDVPERDQGLEMHCRHVYHESCIRQWLNYARQCPLCRRSLSLGKDVPIQVEDTNQPSDVLLEVHKQLWFLQVLSARTNNQSSLAEFLLECVQRRHRTEIEKWVVTTSDAWSMNESWIKTVLVGNFISNSEFDEYRNYYTENAYEFLQKCALTLHEDENEDDVPNISTLLPNENR